MVIATEKIDVIVKNGGAGSRSCGNVITHIERTNSDCFYDADMWKVTEDLDDYGTYNVVHVGDHP